METEFSLDYLKNVEMIAHTEPYEYNSTWLIKLLDSRKKLVSDMLATNNETNVFADHLNQFNRMICECLYIDPKTL